MPDLDEVRIKAEALIEMALSAKPTQEQLLLASFEFTKLAGPATVLALLARLRLAEALAEVVRFHLDDEVWHFDQLESALVAFLEAP